jgi:hypothetical protein
MLFVVSPRENALFAKIEKPFQDDKCFALPTSCYDAHHNMQQTFAFDKIVLCKRLYQIIPAQLYYRSSVKLKLYMKLHTN